MVRIIRSLSSWRAWIEISIYGAPPRNRKSLSSWRAWIEMPCMIALTTPVTSLSSWRAWIEIPRLVSSPYPCSGSLSSWRAWIEILQRRLPLSWDKSLSSWRAWIEICARMGLRNLATSRSPHGERGLKSHPQDVPGLRARVALLMESVD